jgi:hypothetical protein
MAETEYTKGFRAGMAWREAEIIKQMKDTRTEQFLVWLQKAKDFNDTQKDKK